MTPKRDPRTDPQHGDRVTVGNETREVETVTGAKVIYSWPGKVAVRTVSIDDWRRWCAPSFLFTAAAAEAAHEA